VDFERLKQMMVASPFHRWLGVELLRAADGEVEVRLPYRPEFSGNDEGTNIHGGVISTLADITACFAIMSATQNDAPNLDLRVDYLRMAPDGSDLIAIGKTIKAGRSIGVADVEIRTPDGRLVAVGRSTMATNVPSRDVLTSK
jgi:uncharacterized protein (TIGR00369 family)